MRVQAGTNDAVRADAVTYWIAAQLRTPVKIDQSVASVPRLIGSERAPPFCPFSPTPPPFPSLHFTLLICAQTKDNDQLRFTCAVDLTREGLLS